MDGVVRFPATASRAAEADGGRRRDSLFLRATLHLSDESCSREVRIRNLSERGVMAEVGREVAVGTTARIAMRGIGEVTGRVVWSVDDRIGLALDRAVDPRRARKPVGAVADKAPPRR